MKRVNFKKYYDHITTDTYHDVANEVFNILAEYRKAEQAYQSRINYHKAYYSLDRDDGIEHRPCLFPSHPMRFTSVSSQLNSSMQSLPSCPTNVIKIRE